MGSMAPAMPGDVAAAFDAFPAAAAQRLLAVRTIAYRIADEVPQAGGGCGSTLRGVNRAFVR